MDEIARNDEELDEFHRSLKGGPMNKRKPSLKSDAGPPPPPPVTTGFLGDDSEEEDDDDDWESVHTVEVRDASGGEGGRRKPAQRAPQGQQDDFGDDDDGDEDTAVVLDDGMEDDEDEYEDVDMTQLVESIERLAEENTQIKTEFGQMIQMFNNMAQTMQAMVQGGQVQVPMTRNQAVGNEPVNAFDEDDDMMEFDDGIDGGSEPGDAVQGQSSGGWSPYGPSPRQQQMQQQNTALVPQQQQQNLPAVQQQQQPGLLNGNGLQSTIQSMMMLVQMAKDLGIIGGGGGSAMPADPMATMRPALEMIQAVLMVTGDLRRMVFEEQNVSTTAISRLAKVVGKEAFRRDSDGDQQQASGQVTMINQPEGQ